MIIFIRNTASASIHAFNDSGWLAGCFYKAYETVIQNMERGALALYRYRMRYSGDYAAGKWRDRSNGQARKLSLGGIKYKEI